MTKKLNIDIIARDKSKQALNQVQGNLAKTKTSVLNLKNALIGIGAGAILKSFVDVGKEVENLQVRFKFLFGSAEEGQVAFDNLSKFASRVPFSLENIAAASGNLGVVAKDAQDLTRILEITGNVAAFTGLDFETTASQIQRAFSGGIAAADIFREKGLRQILGFEAGAKVSVEETIRAFEKTFGAGGRLGNVTGDLAQTLTGTVSMLQDKLFNFQKLVAEQFIGTLTVELGDLNKFLEDNDETIESLAETLGKGLADGAILAASAIGKIDDAVRAFLETKRDVEEFLELFDTDLFRFLTGTSGIKKYGDALEDMSNKAKGIVDLGEFGRDTGKEFGEALLGLGENTDTATQSIEKNSEALSKNMELAKGMEQFQIRNNKIMKTINHAEIERQRKLDEEVQRVLDNQIRKAKERVELEKRAQNEIVSLTDSALSDLARLNKDAFRAYQLFQIGQAIINAHATASRVMVQYAGLFPLNIAMAGAAYAAGAARVAAIRSAPAPRISGGRVNEGMPYMVGEGGKPELFVPQQSGTIVPNNQLTSPNINITINANDTEGFDDLLLKRRSVIVNVINDALNTQGKEALI